MNRIRARNSTLLSDFVFC